MKIFSKQFLLLIFSVIIFFIFGLIHLTKFISSDEHFWLYNPESDRIHTYWEAIKKGDWEGTRINDKPGITLAYVSGIGMLFEKDPEKQVIFSDGTVKIYNPEKIKKINFLYRLPILLISGFFSFLFFWMIKRITSDEWIALFASSLTLFSPVILGISQIVNPDSLFWIFSFSGLLSFLGLLKLQEKKFFWMTLVFFGLSMASKYVAIIFIPFFFLMMISYYLFEFKNIKKKENLCRRLKKDVAYYLGIIAGGFSIFAIMMPAVFVKVKYFYEGTIGFPGMEPIFWLIMILCLLLLLDAFLKKSFFLEKMLEFFQPLVKILPKIIYLILAVTFFFVIINWLSRHRLIDLEDIPFDSKRKEEFSQIPYAHRFILETVPLVFSLTPFVLFSLIFLWIKGIFQKLVHGYLIFILSMFLIIFYIAVIEQGLLLTIRYSIILYPVSFFLVAMAFREFFPSIKEEETEKKTKKTLAVFSLILSVSILIYIMSSLEQYGLLNQKNLRIFINFHKIFFSLVVFMISISTIFVIYRFLKWKKIEIIKEMHVFIGLFILSLISIFLIRPFYFSYTNDLLPKKYIIVGAWGYGGYEAAQYMNSLPNARETTVWSDAYGFCEFYVGKCIRKIKVNTEKYKIDYFYRTYKGQLKPGFPHKMSEPIWEMELDGRYKNFIRIHKAEDVGIYENNKSE